MSQENVEVVRRAGSAFNERDIQTLEAILTPDVVVRLAGGSSGLVGEEFRGRQARSGLYGGVDGWR
jgi:ketosteroid isomerase-like protein